MKRSNVYYLFALLLLIVSCHERKGIKKQNIDIGPIVISMDEGDKIIKANGVDSYVVYIIKDKDTFTAEYGSPRVVNPLYLPSPNVFRLSRKDTIAKELGREPTPDMAEFSEYPEADYDQRIFDKEYFMYDTINNIVSKIVQPKKIGNGIAGLYIPKLKDGRSFSIYSRNLDSSAHQKAIAIFRGVYYKE